MAVRVTQIGVEVLVGQNTAARSRVTQIGVEALTGRNTAARIRLTQVGLEVLRTVADAPVPPAKPQMIVWW